MTDINNDKDATVGIKKGKDNTSTKKENDDSLAENATGEALGDNKQVKSPEPVEENEPNEPAEGIASPQNTETQIPIKEKPTETSIPKTKNTILQVKDLKYRHLSKTGLFKPEREFTLGPVSFNMQKGETIAIIGNNGSGKTLLAKTLAGALQASSGSIEFIDPDAEPGQSKHRHPIRMILQHSASAMNPAVSVGAMMNNTLRLNSDLGEPQRQQKIEETLLKVGLLRDHFYYYRHMLSDGQQQRVALARALLLDPKIIVADEPFAALDPSVRSQTVNLILKLQHELGLGFFFISHNIGIVRHVSDRVLVLDKGQIIEQGKTDEVFAEPKEALTQKLVQAHFNLVERHLSLL